MNNLTITSNLNNSAATMSSREIATLTGKQHNHVLRDIRSMLCEIYDLKDGPDLDHKEIQGVTSEYDNRNYIIAISLDKSHSLNLVTGYSAKLRMMVINRWQELEAQVAAPQHNLPTTYLDALEAQAVANQPKVEVYEEMVADNVSTFMVRETAKLLGYKESVFRRWLERDNYIFRNPKGQWEPTAQSISRDIIRHKIEMIAGRSVSSPAITTKGLVLFRHMLGADDMLKSTVGRAAAVRAH